MEVGRGPGSAGRAAGRSHAKLKELLVQDFFVLDTIVDQLRGYDDCLYCAGASSVGMTETDFTRITYDTTITFARALHGNSPQATFIYVSGAGTYNSAKGRMMWARVKGRTEHDLSHLGFRQQFSFRPAIMTLTPGMRNPKWWMRVLVPFFAALLPRATCKMKEVGLAMINAMLKGYSKQTLEVKDIRILAKG
jgi:hypothetical protein